MEWRFTRLEEDEYETEEGKARLRLHKFRERDSKLVRIAKQRFLATHGNLHCEARFFSFPALYGFEYI
jgi:5-methylcytosine-specific restriction protein A